MPTVAIVSPGAMGSAVAAALVRGGTTVVATIAERSARTARLAQQVELALRPDLESVVREADVVLSIVPPGEAEAVAEDVAAVARAAGSTSLYVELNAISPARARAIDGVVASAELELVDGAISGPPPWRAGTTRVYLSGTRAAEVARLPFEGVELVVVGPDVGSASAVKMSTASVYKGTTALLAHALLAGHAHGVLEHVLDDLGDGSPELLERVERRLASAASKSGRYVPEMREIAATQAAAGLTPALFDAFAEVYASLAGSELAEVGPEEIPMEARLEDVLDGLRHERRPHVG